jgi:hypothetical protein
MDTIIYAASFILTTTLVIGLTYLVTFLTKKTDTFENSENVISVQTCKNCKAWNNRDAQSHCNKACGLENPKNIFTGIWTKNGNDISCECNRKGTLQSEYVGCKLGDKLTNKQDCFLLNNKEAKEKCQLIFNKYLVPGKVNKWTGNWKNTSANTSACECSYYS